MKLRFNLNWVFFGLFYGHVNPFLGLSLSFSEIASFRPEKAFRSSGLKGGLFYRLTWRALG